MAMRSGEIAPQLPEFNTPIEECVAVVVDPNHPRFGEVADIRYHDWKGYGDVGITFEDGQIDTLKDGILSSDTVLPQVRIMRRDESDAISDLLARLPEVQAKLREMTGINHKRINPHNSKLSAKQAFKQFVDGSATDERLF